MSSTKGRIPSHRVHRRHVRRLAFSPTDPQSTGRLGLNTWVEARSAIPDGWLLRVAEAKSRLQNMDAAISESDPDPWAPCAGAARPGGWDAAAPDALTVHGPTPLWAGPGVNLSVAGRPAEGKCRNC